MPCREEVLLADLKSLRSSVNEYLYRAEFAAARIEQARYNAKQHQLRELRLRYALPHLLFELPCVFERTENRES